MVLVDHHAIEALFSPTGEPDSLLDCYSPEAHGDGGSHRHGVRMIGASTVGSTCVNAAVNLRLLQKTSNLS